MKTQETIGVKNETYARLEERAKKQGISVSEYVAIFLDSKDRT